MVKRGCVYVTKKEAQAKTGENSSRKQNKAEGEEENGQDVSSRRVVPETQTGPAPYNLYLYLGTLRCFCFKYSGETSDFSHFVNFAFYSQTPRCK